MAVPSALPGIAPGCPKRNLLLALIYLELTLVGIGIVFGL